MWKRITQRAQAYVNSLSKEDLQGMTTKIDIVKKEDGSSVENIMYDNRSNKFDGDDDPPVKKSEYVHRSIIIKKGYVHFANPKHRQGVAYWHPWMKGYLERVSKALWSAPPMFCKPGTEKDEEPKIDEGIMQFWAENRLQAAIKKSWYKSQVHGICFYYPMVPEEFFEGYSGPPWYIYSQDELMQPFHFIQGHPTAWKPSHSNPEKTSPETILLNQGVFYDFTNSDDFTGEPFGTGIWDLLIDWIYQKDAVDSFDQRMGNGFFSIVVPNNTTDEDEAYYKDVIANTRTEKGILIRGAVEEPVELNWVGMAGMQVDFVAHMEKTEDLIAFNMGFPKRWLMGDNTSAEVSSGNDHQEINIQLKNLYADWTLYIKQILKYHGQIKKLNDIFIKPPFELQLSESEKVGIEQDKALTIASKTWMTPNEQRKADGMEPIQEEGADKLMALTTDEGPDKPKASDDTKRDNQPQKTDTVTQLIDIYTNGKISVPDLALLTGVSPNTVSKQREFLDSIKDPVFKQDAIPMEITNDGHSEKCDAISLDDDLYEIRDVPLILPQTKFYEKLGYNSIRSKEEIAKIFNDPKYPKEFRIGTTITDDHASKVPLEVLNKNTVGMVKLMRLDTQGCIRGNITYSLKEADRILGKNNFIRTKTKNRENINTSVAIWTKDRPVKGGMYESDIDIRSFVFTNKNARNKDAGL